MDEIVFMCGINYAGKTTICKQLAQQDSRFRHFDPDLDETIRNGVEASISFINENRKYILLMEMFGYTIASRKLTINNIKKAADWHDGFLEYWEKKIEHKNWEEVLFYVDIPLEEALRRREQEEKELGGSRITEYWVRRLQSLKKVPEGDEGLGMDSYVLDGTQPVEKSIEQILAVIDKNS